MATSFLKNQHVDVAPPLGLVANLSLTQLLESVLLCMFWDLQHLRIEEGNG